MSRRARIRRHSRHRVARTVLTVGAVTAALVLFAGTVAVAAGSALVGSWLKGLPDIDDKAAFAVAQTTRIYSADGKLLANLYLENRQVVPLAKISPHLQKAIVAVEDERFWTHKGFDTIGIVRAAITNLRAGGVQEGASTITQQIVRNTVLADERFDISLRRKAREAYLAYQLEKRMSKTDILGMYLNTVYFGEGAYGAESASLTFFGKHASDLTIAEAALLAGLPQGPSRLNPYTNPDAAYARRQWVLKRMFETGAITSQEYEAAKQEPVVLKRAPQVAETGVYQAPYFVAHVKKILQEKYGTALVFKGGLTVYTTLDTRTQTLAENAVRNVLDRPGDPDAALVAIDPDTGYIKALVGGRDWETNKFNFATQAHRQAGSAFKVFTLVTALEEGMPPHRMLDSSSPAVIKTGGKPWVVDNAEGHGRGYITLQAATVGSVNTCYARLIKELGAEKVIKTAKRMGITSPLKPYLSVTLGTQGVTPLEMASAFGTLAANGRHFPPVAVTKIKDANGKVIFEAKPEGRQAISHSIAFAATKILKGVISSGTATRARIGRPAAGKTGTTQDYRDAWFVGYTPDLVCAVWMGYTPERPMRNVHGRRVFGGTFPAQIWHDFMIEALKGTPVRDFTPAPAPKYTWKKDWDVPDTKVPSVVGMTESAAKKALEDAKFVVKIAYAYSSTVPSGTVISQSPAAGSKLAPGETVTIVVSKGPDPSAPPPPEPTGTPEPTPTP
ncbi:MAG: PBP1A family penicillin-binding protein [Coriobacteriia bacterium]|nr:PBP1A family penicillin-binding protein [Coriobacteriia bacterium]